MRSFIILTALLSLLPVLCRPQPAPVPHDSATVARMYDFIQDWWRTKYRYGGTGRRGIDCSAFTRVMYDSVYGKSLPRTASLQYSSTRRVSKSELMPGDLVFFRYRPRGGTSGWHVGVYITAGFFVHSSVATGVFVNNLAEPKYVRIYYSAGRP